MLFGKERIQQHLTWLKQLQAKKNKSLDSKANSHIDSSVTMYSKSLGDAALKTPQGRQASTNDASTGATVNDHQNRGTTVTRAEACYYF